MRVGRQFAFNFNTLINFFPTHKQLFTSTSYDEQTARCTPSTWGQTKLATVNVSAHLAAEELDISLRRSKTELKEAEY